MSIIDLHSICFRRQEKKILDEVSWTIQAGGHCALLGANGSGKTTLLKIVTGYEWPTSGRVEVLGKRFGACDLPQLRKTIGWVSSAIEERLPHNDTALDVVLSGLEASMGVYRSFDDEEMAKALEALASLEAEDLAQQPFGRLSQGEQQRVLIARALVVKPRLLILDEPCVGLDPAARHHFLADLAGFALADRAPTIILVTHHIEEIGPWIEQALILKRGTVLAHGTPSEVLTDAILGEALDAECYVTRDLSRYRLTVSPP